MDTDGTPIDSMVGISHRRAGREIGQAIVRAGHRKIGFLGSAVGLDHRARKRFEGFTQALAKAGIEMADQDFYSGGSALAKGREMTAAMMQRSPDLDFLYYSNDLIGAGGLLWMIEQGFDIPGQVGMAGFNGVRLLSGLPKKLATIDSCREEIGRRAAEIIAERLTDADGAGQKVELTPVIDFGDTMRR